MPRKLASIPARNNLQTLIRSNGSDFGAHYGKGAIVGLTLLTLLGRSPKAENEGYRTTTHTFPDGSQDEPTAFFGWRLLDWLKPRRDRMVVLGTAGSMWDYLFETADHDGSLEEARLALQVPTEEKRVDQALLDQWAPVLQTRLDVDLRLVIIPYGRSEAEQLELVETIAAHVQEGDGVDLDVTHGFRHLPMLAFVAALYLREVKRAEIHAIWYTAFDADSAEAPVYDLQGLLRVADWIGALQTFDKDGDYSVFEPLLQSSWNAPVLKGLREAAYFERVSRINEAQGKLRGVDAALSRESPGSVTGLFAPLLRKRIGWIHGANPYQHQRALAKGHLAQRDYLRAAILAYEAFITRQALKQGKDPSDRRQRDDARKKFENYLPEIKKRDPGVEIDYRLLQDLRNHFAHGSQAESAEVEDIAASPDRVGRELARLIESLLPKER